jgi:hypothetical protein
LRESWTRRVVERTVDVASWETSGGSLLHPDLVALGNLAFELLTANLATLGERNVERLVANHLVVHLGDSLGSFVRRRKADKAKALGGPLVVAHNLAASDRAEGLEFSAKLLVIHIVVQVLDVEVDALVLAHLLHLGRLVGSAEFLLTLSLLLGASDKEFLAIEFKVVQFVDCSLCFFVSFVIDEPEAFAVALLVCGNDSRGDIAKLLEQLLEFLLSDLRVKVLDVEVGELSPHFLDLGLTFLKIT